MRRPRRALLAATSLVLLLAACGAREATQGSVRDAMKESLLDRDDLDISDGDAAEIADCVSRGMFESGDFSKDERNEATRALDGDEADPDLVAKVVALVEGCGDEVDLDLGSTGAPTEGTTTTTSG